MKSALLLFLGFSVITHSQTTGNADTKGVCSPANTGNSNTFNITCGIGKQQGDQMVRIMNKILNRQLDPDAVMAKLDEIGKDVKALRRGVYSGYDFNGAKREATPGRNVVAVGKEFEIFQQMVQLQRDQKWAELLNLCEKQLQATPDWLTPYLFSGIANLKVGNRDAGISRLEFVKKESAGNPDYSDAERILKQIR